MPELILAILPILAAAIGWGFYLAYRAGQILAVVATSLRNLDTRLTAVERRCPPPAPTPAPAPVPAPALRLHPQ